MTDTPIETTYSPQIDTENVRVISYDPTVNVYESCESVSNLPPALPLDQQDSYIATERKDENHVTYIYDHEVYTARKMRQEIQELLDE